MSDDDAWPDGLDEARRLFGTPDGAEPVTVDGDVDDSDRVRHVLGRSLGGTAGLVVLGLIAALVVVFVVAPLLLWPVGAWIALLEPPPVELPSPWWFTELPGRYA
ncbi:hypothetical protein [Frigoribacterium faeni]|uniref:hypothetical protein n=1 Tax=Frigoribacterium faeni TaxID=145483 RepID=UPI00141B4892|nr:hypothetical protein [Frigoribacterium faeni]NIJ05349.1 hypothetical protein [Frigoribacterium faeni]